MKNTHQIKYRALALIVALLIVIAMSVRMHANTGTCSGISITLPFTDVPSTNIFFCSIAEAYFSGLTNGTTATTYGPSEPVPREQMAAFITRTMDQSLKRGSRRSALDQWWIPSDTGALRPVSFNAGSILSDLICDGEDLWITDEAGVVFRVHASDGKKLGTWTGATLAPRGLVAAAGRIFIATSTGATTPGKIYVINPEAAPGAVTVFENDIGANPYAITFDGANLWTANLSGSISRVNVGTTIDSTFTGFGMAVNIIWDGTNLWVNDGQIKRVDPANGTVLQTIPISGIGNMRFDGTNLWMSGYNDNSVTIMRAIGGLRGTVLATITGGTLQGPYGMAFDGERMLVCNSGNNTVSLYGAADFTPLGSVYTGDLSDPRFACNDGVNFWVIRYTKRDIVRF